MPSAPDYQRALSEIRQVPGVAGAAIASQLPFSGMAQDGDYLPYRQSRQGFTRLVFALVAALIIVVALAAVAIPARRATRIDPVRVLNAE